MSNQILNYFGRAHADYIHASGKLASNRIIELLQPQPKEKILEVGFGTGATLIRLASTCKKGKFFGYELSDIMLKKAFERIRFCRLTNKIHLTLLEKKNKFPAPDNTFDKVYLESIIGIQEGDDFKALLLEIQRVLRPNGILIFNETIWLETTDKETAKRINEACKLQFGIIQANHDFTHLKNWKKLLFQIGFDCQFEERIANIRSDSAEKLFSIPIMLSNVYTLIGKIKAGINTPMRKEWNRYKKEMATLMNNSDKLMEGIIIKASNKKP